MSHPISFLRYQTKCVIKLLLKQFTVSKTFQVFLASTTKATADTEKEGKTKIQKLEYLEKEKSFLDEIKNIFHIF